jgi:surface antigen
LYAKPDRATTHKLEVKDKRLARLAKYVKALSQTSGGAPVAWLDIKRRRHARCVAKPRMFAKFASWI